MDLEVRFLDSLSGVDTSSVRLISDRTVKGLAPASSDLLALWEVTEADSGGFVIEEVPDHLLPRGDVELTIEVSDREGNVATRRIPLNLPAAARHKVIDLHAEIVLTTQILLSPDGRRLYVTTEEPGGSAMSIVDPGSLEWLKTERWPRRGLSRMAYDARRNRIYAMSLNHPEVGIFDVTGERFIGSIATATRGVGVALSHQRDELYVGLEVEGPNNGLISVIDLAQEVQSRIIDLGVSSTFNPGAALVMNLALDASEQTLFILTNQEGLLVVDPVVGELLDQVPLLEASPFFGGGKDLILDGDRLLASLHGEVIARIPVDDPREYDLISTQTFGDALSIAVSPDRQEWAVTHSSRFGSLERSIVVMDAVSPEIYFSEVLPPTSDIRQDIVFRPDGNVFFAVGGREFRLPASTPNELTVYLHR